MLDGAAYGADAQLDENELSRILDNEAPFAALYGFRVEGFGDGRASVRLPHDARFLRPGGTVCGPAMMALADFALWIAVMGALGPVPLAVTTSFTCNFLTKPENRDLICEARLIKRGQRLCVGEMWVAADGAEAPCAHVTATYSIPPGAPGR